MGYRLGVDLGTTFTAAAVSRGGRPELVTLGDDAPEVPTVVFLREDGELVVGEVASSRGRAAPQRVAREFKRWLGDPTPMLLAGTPYSAHALLAAVLRWVVQRVAEQEGQAADTVVVTHPANWGPYKRELMQQVLTMADVGDATLRPEPVAAALGYASMQRLQVGDVVAVYDLGGGTFDAAVLARTADGFDVVGEPAGVEQLGGVDVDDALFSHVLGALDGAVDELDPDDETVLRGLAQLRQDCTIAKIRLSRDAEWVVPVGLPGLHTTVRVTRTELEDLVRPLLAETLRALHRALRSAGTDREGLSRVLLAGGSSSIPLVSEMLSADLGRPVAVDAPPKHLVALGAALEDTSAVASDDTAGTVPQPLPRQVLPDERPGAPGDGVPAAAGAAGAAGAGAAAPGVAAPVEDGAPTGGRGRSRLAVAAAALALTTIGVALFGLGGAAGTDSLRVNGTTTSQDRATLAAERPGLLDVEATGDVSAVAVRFLAWELPAEPERDGTWDLGQAQLLVAGAVPAKATVDGEPAGFVLEPRGWRWASLPVAAAVVGLLLLLGFGESLLGPVRRGRPVTPARLAALGTIGAGLGLVVAVGAWTVGPAVLTTPVLVTCAVLGAAAAVCAVLATSRRRSRDDDGPAPRPAHGRASGRRTGDDVPRGASDDPNSR